MEASLEGWRSALNCRGSDFAFWVACGFVDCNDVSFSSFPFLRSHHGAVLLFLFCFVLFLLFQFIVTQDPSV